MDLVEKEMNKPGFAEKMEKWDWLICKETRDVLSPDLSAISAAWRPSTMAPSLLNVNSGSKFTNDFFQANFFANMLQIPCLGSSPSDNSSTSEQPLMQPDQSVVIGV